jgi:phosphomannomutase/phosphoglucomutase
MELKQDQLTLASIGKTSSKNDDPETVQVPNSRWQILYWPDVGTTGGDIGLMLAIVALPCLLTCLSFFVGYRKLDEYLREDQSSILKAAKDMMQGKVVGNYPVHLDEMLPVISSLAQFKRVIGQVIGQDVSPVDSIVGKEPDFFDESFDIDFLEDSASVPMPSGDGEFKSTETVAISMPSFDVIDEEPFKDELPAETTVTISPSIGRPEDFVKPKPLSETLLDIPIPDSWDLEIETKTKTILTPSARSGFASGNIQPPANFETPQSDSPASIFRNYDIRGIVGENFNQEIVGNIGRAFASEASDQGIKTIVVAQDGRLSSPELCAALIEGITQTGCNVLDIGMVPTPMLYFVAYHTEGRTGIMVTGSSGPGDHNGLKLVLNNEIPGSKEIQALKQRLDLGDYQRGEIGSVTRNSAFRNEYIGLISEETHIVRPMTVVVDCGNGSTSELAPILLKTIGCDVVELNCELDGKFPNHVPDPGKPENYDSLIKAVKLNNADVGIFLDGDGDRLGIVDSSGRIIWPDRQMMLFARDVLAAKPATEVLYDSACSKYLPEQISKRGGRPVMSNSRHDVIHAELKSYDASLAGTMSGHFFFNDRWFGFNDGLYAAVRMIELLSADMRSSSELFDDLPDSVSTPEMHMPLAGIETTRFVEQLAAAIDFEAEIVTTDGLRVEFADGWGLVRASATEQGLILRFEADSSEALTRIQNQLKQLMLHVKADISLPF